MKNLLILILLAVIAYLLYTSGTLSRAVKIAQTAVPALGTLTGDDTTPEISVTVYSPYGTGRTPQPGQVTAIAPQPVRAAAGRASGDGPPRSDRTDRVSNHAPASDDYHPGDSADVGRRDDAYPFRHFRHHGRFAARRRDSSMRHRSSCAARLRLMQWSV